jgi:hypothetical protein
MTRFLRHCRTSIGVFLAIGSVAGMALGAKPGKTGAAAIAIYEKRDTWAETLATARTNYARFLEGLQTQFPGVTAQPFASDSIQGTTPPQHISIPIAAVHSLRLVTVLEQNPGNLGIWGDAKLIDKAGKETQLSSLKPAFVRVGWGQLCLDQNWQREPLQIGDKKFEHGLWVHADSDLCYQLPGKFERFEAWIGLDHARASGALRFKVMFDAPDVLPAVWQKLVADYPQQAKWMVDDSPRSTFLNWLSAAGSVQHDQAIIQSALAPLGTGAASLQQEFQALRKARPPASDSIYLDLYGRICRYRECAGSLEQIGLIELRTRIEKQFDEVLRAKTALDDSRWAELKAKAVRLADRATTIHPTSLSALRMSLSALTGAMPQRFTQAQELSAQLDTLQKRWDRCSAGVASGNEQALAEAVQLQQDVKAFRHSLLLALRGMGPSLAAGGLVNFEAEWESQYQVLQSDLKHRSDFDRFAPETHCTAALIVAADRDPADVVLRRTAALAADLQKKGSGAVSARGGDCPNFRPSENGTVPFRGAFISQLAELQAAAAAIPPENSEARYVLYADACRLRRQIALQNPLLDFNQLLFIKRNRSNYNHMCDQYYGTTARPGGGLFVLADPFGANPQVRDVLAGATVAAGRLSGHKLEGGCFVSPSLSFDARQVLFAFVECTGDRAQQFHTDPMRGHWSEGWSYHIFKVNLDGSHLQQLTDGTWNDFDPCWLPNGRIALITERRGGYLRCGRACPTYTLFDMADDGGDMNCLSFHETNEWHPSLTHDGRIIYTRWDYVDRFGCTAHLPWITTLDGRDSRAVHGNFAPRQSRPDMELDVRAIPGSHKYTATAAPHHGQAFGSLVLLDPHVHDDDGMAPVKRITPDVGFPESQGGLEAYGTAWPLSEDYYLCVYDAEMALHRDARMGRGNYGIYLVDAFGNKELLYRDAEIACQSPIPVRATPRPPVVPSGIAAGARINPAAQPASAVLPAEGTLSVINVYDSLKGWPAGTKITAIRVLQVLPMTVPSGGPPHDTGIRIVSAGDSVVAARRVLGTVPVEEDGSAHFSVPANKEMFFQALDQRGLAVQSMRSATYLHQGEHLVCQGCHEPKHRTPLGAADLPLALRRAPSKIQPDVDGSNPFSYPRLVQPVLERNCTNCHAQHADKAPSLAKEPIQKHWFASYVSLAPKFGFYNYGDGYRTTPGKFGARASKLWEILEKGHYDVKLSPEDLHRLTLWLDCSSMFYGVYEKEGGEAQLRGEIAQPTLE